VLLAHQPRAVEEAIEKGIGLQLSGHTHGGQLFPMTALVAAAVEVLRGALPGG
jgi:predicted MPP superfamily phosphohydrolase